MSSTTEKRHFGVDVEVQVRETFYVRVDAQDEEEARQIAERLVAENAYVDVNRRRTRRDDGQFSADPYRYGDVETEEVRVVEEVDEDGEPVALEAGAPGAAQSLSPC